MSNGANEENMKTLLGHADVETTRKYIHGRHKQSQKIDKIAGQINLGLNYQKGISGVQKPEGKVLKLVENSW